nr:unnamed protein product [Callosobruchus chinensis]
MPPDRMFGLSESKINNTPSLTDPSEYCSIIEEFATAGEVNYKSDLGMDKSVLKRMQKISFLGLNTMNPVIVSDKKKADSAANLLQLHFGADWSDDGRLDFYKKAIEFATMENSVLDQDSHQEECCSRLETEDDLRV